jgi:hypothetical protein
MPTFRSAPSANLARSIKNLAASRQLRDSPLIEIQADQLAAQNARNMSLAEKARLEAQALRDAQAQRDNPSTAIEYGADASRISVPDATRLYGASRGVEEPWSAADQDDAGMAGREYQPYTMAEPNVADSQKGLFRAALAAVGANKLATGKTNPAQIAQAAGRTQDQQLVAGAVGEEDPTLFNRALVTAGRRPYTPNRMGSSGAVVDQATGDVSVDNPMAQGTIAQRAAAAARDSAAGRRHDRYVPGGSRGATAVAPERITRMIDMTALNEYRAKKAAYDGLPRSVREKTPAPTIEAVRAEVEKRYRQRAPSPNEREEAEQAIADGADPIAVARRYKENTGLDLDADVEE